MYGLLYECKFLTIEETNKKNKLLLSFGLTRPVLELIIYHTWGEHANYFTTDRLVVMYNWIKAVANNCQ